ncbi:MAG TPA: response regulator [Candidatus Bathyarchaeia archaeon]|nr:response regulator [Candidatus Bathyarchaeia archaeon]
MSRKILVVDDDELTLRLLTTRLQAARFAVIEANNGRDALRKAISDRPDIVIMDIMLPDMQGSDAVKLMQDNPELSNIKIIFLSGIISRQDDSGQTIQVSGQFYPAVAKPIDFEKLMSLF